VKIAHIVPPYVADLVQEQIGDYHLLLPHLVPLARYRDYYRNDVGYKIMDNGVAEGRATTFTQQLFMAKAMGCKEVVLPDVMGDMDKTLSAVARAFPMAFVERNNYQFMFVVQGRTILECVNCGERALNTFPGIINSFGIPRHILRVTADARVRLVHLLKNMSPKRPIHLLGTHPHLPGELLRFGQFFCELGVRGVDTSMAWNAACQNIHLPHKGPIERQPMEEFAEAIPVEQQLKLLLQNMEVMNSWVRSTP